MIRKPISIKQFRDAIKKLPSDEPRVVPGVWYKTQKEHWLGWLGEYNSPGAYGRKNWNRDARFAYNHVVCPELLLYLIRAIPLQPELIEAVEAAYQQGTSLMQKSGAIRKFVSWEVIEQALWQKQPRKGIKELLWKNNR